MEALELLEIIDRGEDSRNQFKETVTGAKKLADEIVAFSNSHGGVIVVGVTDRGELKGLSASEINRINQHVSNATTNNIRPAVNVETEIVPIEKKNMLVIHVPEGVNKPYCDNDGVFWVKNGADKRKVTAPEALHRLFQDGKKIFADNTPVEGTTINDLNREKFNKYFKRVYERNPDDKELPPIEKLLENLHLAKGGHLNLGGLLLFGKNPSRFLPVFIIKAVAFYGNSLAGTDYRDSEDIEGDLETQFEKGMGFLLRNLRKTQQGQNFNSLGILEVSKIALEEVLQNALIHRDYFKSSPIRLLIFDDRIEIISPGKLPNTLTVENIKYGYSVIRNSLIASFAGRILPFRGLGSGIIRALKEQPGIEFYNDTEGEQFKVVIPRPSPD
jgi:ATP-dependent DNA helicase RecG